MTYDQACEIYNKWTEFQNTEEFIERSYEDDHKTLTFTKSVRWYCEHAEKMFSKDLKKHEIAKATKAIIRICQDAVNNEPDLIKSKKQREWVLGK